MASSSTAIFLWAPLDTALAALRLRDRPTGLLKVILPPGISFYTFQQVAYVVDVYKGESEPAGSLLDYSLFVSLSAHLIAGLSSKQGLHPRHTKPQAN